MGLYGRPKGAAAPWTAPVVTTVAVMTAYFLAARLSLALLEKPDGVAVFWPAAGLASGLLIVMGSAARWPVVLGVMAATIGANLLGDRNVGSSLLSAVANAIEAVTVAGLIERAYGSSFELNTLPRVIGLLAATIVGSLVSGIPGTLGFIWFHDATVSLSTLWFHWVASDSLGTLTVAPLVIGLASLMRNVPSRRELAESALAIAVLCALCTFLVLSPNQPWTFELATVSLCPLFVWMAARLPPGVTSAATFICAITVVLTTTFSIGMFGDSHLSFEQRIRTAQASILAISFGALVLTALFSERRLHERALLEREVRLQEALGAGGVMAFEWDLTADQVRHSQNAAPILGLDSKEILRGSELLGRIHPDDRARVTTCLDDIRAGKPSYTVTFRYRRANGDCELWLEQVATAQFNVYGLPMVIRGLTTDITERKRFEEQISEAQHRAERADRGKSVFLAAASHDLRQPLQTLRLLLDGLEQQRQESEQQETINAIRHSVDTMSSVLSSLLDINGLEAGNPRPLKSDFFVNEIFESVASDILRPLTDKGLQWRVVLSGLAIHSDRRMLEQMIRNLLANAVRYTDRGKILLGCRRLGDRVRIEVWDTGIGIAGAQLPHIFEEYYRDPERGGFGLGLAIVRRLGEILDHRVDVRSTPGKGTVFSIEVPRARTYAGASELVRAPESDSGRPFRGTILIIEDEMSVRTALTRMLKLKGVDSMAVATVNEAMTMIGRKELSPDLALCDYNLPGPMNGLESINLLRGALNRELPAIVMTGDIRSKTMEAAAARGVSVLVKPFFVAELFQLIERIHSGSQSKAERAVH